MLKSFLFISVLSVFHFLDLDLRDRFCLKCLVDKQLMRGFSQRWIEPRNHVSLREFLLRVLALHLGDCLGALEILVQVLALLRMLLIVKAFYLSCRLRGRGEYLLLFHHIIALTVRGLIT